MGPLASKGCQIGDKTLQNPQFSFKIFGGSLTRLSQDTRNPSEGRVHVNFENAWHHFELVPDALHHLTKAIQAISRELLRRFSAMVAT